MGDHVICFGVKISEAIKSNNSVGSRRQIDYYFELITPKEMFY